MDDDLQILKKDHERLESKHKKAHKNEKMMLKKIKLIKLMEKHMTNLEFVHFMDEFYPFETEGNEKLISFLIKKIENEEIWVFRDMRLFLERKFLKTKREKLEVLEKEFF